jgi:hypothetical protein
VTVAALYVDPKGVYANLPDVEVWDEERDARTYAGPWPVVAHPPCQRWCQLAALVEALYGYKQGDDGGTFAAALKAVRTWRGILEHPAYSRAWTRYELPRPVRGVWTRSLLDPGYVTEVSQSAYGHAARKRTWLYYVGDDPPSDLILDDPRGDAQVSSFRSRRPGADRWNDRHLDHGRSSYTTPSFRDALLKAALGAA